MSYINTERELISLECTSNQEKAKLKKKLMVSPALLIAGLLIIGDVAADQSASNLPGADQFITVQQQQEMINWSFRTQEKLSKSLDVKIQEELTSTLLLSDGNLDTQFLAIELPTQQSLYAGNPASPPCRGTRTSSRACYVGTQK